MREYNRRNYVMGKLNLNYDRKAAKEYAERYALNPNINNYPYFETDDCANFVSQVLKAGGIDETGYPRWDKLESWFCNTINTKDLTNIAITWRAARYFRRHWGNEDGLGRNRAAEYIILTVQQALDNFEKLYPLLYEGDVIQHGDPNQNNYPYHTQVIHGKGYNFQVGRYDLFMAQHTENRLYVSLYDYLNRFDNKSLRFVYIYRIKID